MKKQHLNFEKKTEIVQQILASKITASEASRSLNVHKSVIYRWLKRFQNKQPLVRKVSVKTKKICGLKSESLLTVISKPATDFGFSSELWTPERFRTVIKIELNIVVSKMTINRTLKAFISPVDEEIAKLVKFSKSANLAHNSPLYFHHYFFVTLSHDRKRIIHFNRAIHKYHRRNFFTVMLMINSANRILFKVYKGINAVRSKYVCDLIEQMRSHHHRKPIAICLPETAMYTTKSIDKVRHKYRKNLIIIKKPMDRSEFLFDTF